ncbi:hypothetical protein CSPX01_12274, partial [Colletotrichum filicis]
AWGGSQLIGKLPNITSLHIHGITQLKFFNDPVPCHGYPTLVHLRSLEVFIFSRDESPDGSIIQELSWNNWNLDLEITPRQIVDQISIKVSQKMLYNKDSNRISRSARHVLNHVSILNIVYIDLFLLSISILIY